MIRYLTTQQVLFIHARLIATTGGESGLRDLGLLQSAAACPQATFDGTDLYADLWQKAAALMESLAQNHAFVDGNKRTAVTAAALFLKRNGRTLQTTSTELEQFTLHVVNNHPPLDETAAWFATNTTPIT